MASSISAIYVIIHLLAVLALATAPFIFFNAYADNNQNEWKVSIQKGSSLEVQKNGFYPDELPVKVGDIIIWENEDTIIHSITSGLPEHPEHSGLFFNLGHIEPGKSVFYVMPDSDFLAFYYFCEIHPWMSGKFFNSDLEVAQPEVDNEIITNHNDYKYGDLITISGQVHKDFADTAYAILFYDQNNNLIDVLNGNFDHKSSYIQSINARGSAWEANENYQLKLVYGVPSKSSETSFHLSGKSDISESEKLIPIWIKNIGGYWCIDKISDSEFIDAIQFLIKEEIIHLKNTVSSTSNSDTVPKWIKNNACWWSDDKIPEIEFISGIEFLINLGTIKV